MAESGPGAPRPARNIEPYEEVAIEMGDTAPVTAQGTDEWTPARWFMLIAAVWHVSLGIPA